LPSGHARKHRPSAGKNLGSDALVRCDPDPETFAGEPQWRHYRGHIEQRAMGIGHERLWVGYGLHLGDVRAPLDPNAALDRLRHRAPRVVQR
jgi:hypothetical protein